MNVSFGFSRRRPVGISMIGVLIVLVVIFLLAGYFFRGSLMDVDQTQRDVGTYQVTTGRAKSVAEGENIRVLQTHVNSWAMTHPGERCTLAKLHAAGVSVPAPPAGKRWDIDAQNTVRLADEEVHVRGVPLSPTGP
jgi:hypothetical protein